MRHWHTLVIAGPLLVVLAVALTLVAPGGQDSLAADGTPYVDADATGANDGTSWDDAYTTLQPALATASSGDEIWVATGVYTPTHEFAPGDPRSATFQMKNDVALYGGFDPDAGDAAFEDRDWVLHETILSGDIGTGGDDTDNSYHVFYHPWGLALDSTAILDGFTITGSNANHVDEPHDGGGGMYNEGSSPALANCTFADNSASYGAGMLNWLSSPTLTNCTFSGNSADGIGGGIYNLSSPLLTNCTFWGNTAGSEGGGICHAASTPALTNCTFWGNSAGSEGGGMYNDHSSPTLTNSILWGDSPDEIFNDHYSSPVVSYSDIQGGYSGAGNMDADPRFADPDNGDFHLVPGSPCIDVGNNAAPDLPGYDFEGDPRIIDGNRDGVPTADMGVDEAWFRANFLPLVLKGY